MFYFFNMRNIVGTLVVNVLKQTSNKTMFYANVLRTLNTRNETSCNVDQISSDLHRSEFRPDVAC